ncbi:MAG TPA: hypothetical protein VEH49_06090, partial [Methylomirabilota bacterium]|nr:hypothetical protein [Methylomirabilota bacterium]
MRASGKILIALVSLLLAVAGTGVFLTRTPSGPVAVQPKQGPPPPPLVDEQPLRTARAVSILASTIEEEVLSKKTLHIADHDVDL